MLSMVLFKAILVLTGPANNTFFRAFDSKRRKGEI